MKKLTQFFQVSVHVYPCYLLQQMTGNSFTATANKNLLKNTAKPPWYWHLRDRALSLLYRGVVYFTELGCVQNLVLLSLHNGHYFFPFIRRAKASVEPARNARHTWWGKAQTKKKKKLIFSVPFLFDCVWHSLALASCLPWLTWKMQKINACYAG